MGPGIHRLCGARVASLAPATMVRGGGMTHNPLLVSALVATATWHAWSWYFRRVAVAPEEAAALVMTVAFLGFVGVSRLSRPEPPQLLPLFPIASLLALLAATHAILPPIVKAAAALALTLFCLHVAMFKERPPVAFWGLLALSLPVLP